MRIGIARRALLAALAPLQLLALTAAASAQAPADLPRIAIVEQGEPAENIAIGGHPWWAAFLTRLGELGHREGETVAIDRWTAAGQDDAGFARLAETVVATGPALIVARGVRGMAAFKSATTTIPIVGAGTIDALVASLARPGGNLTGINVNAGPELNMKHLQLLRDAVAGTTRIAWLGPADFWSSAVGLAAQEGAARLQITLIPFFVAPPTGEDSIGAAFGAMADAGFPALYVSSSPDLTPHRRLIAELAVAAGLPAIGLQLEYPQAGLLMAYGPDFISIYRDLAGFADRILQGEVPAEMAIEQPTEFEFIVNLRTAQALGLTLPPEIMLFATEVIE